MTGRFVRVWDPVVRLFHWGLVAGVVATWVTADNYRDWHERIGYAVAILLAVRLVWGVLGSQHARFGSFVRGPRAVVEYLLELRRGEARRYLGHNPAGAAMIVLLLVSVAIVASTGWMYTLDAFWGVEWVETTHHLVAEGMLVLVVVHVLGVIQASLAHRENLVLAMFTGRKRADENIRDDNVSDENGDIKPTAR